MFILSFIFVILYFESFILVIYVSTFYYSNFFSLKILIYIMELINYSLNVDMTYLYNCLLDIIIPHVK